MTGNSISCTSFYSDSLNSVKYGYLLDKAKAINKLKNDISKEICKNPFAIADLTRFDFLNKFACKIEGLVAKEIQPALTDVYTCYKNKIDQLNHGTSFHVQKSMETTLYKKKTKKNKKGETKEFNVLFKKTNLTSALTFCAKYYNETLIDYMIGELNNIDTRKTEGQLLLYKSVFHYIDKFGDRFFKLVEARRNRVVKRVFSKPIEFKSLTFSAINNLKLISENTNDKSKLTHYITLGGYQNITETGRLDIPVRYDKEYHGDINVFNKGQTSYLVQFTNKKIRIVLTKDVIRTYKDDGNEIIGVDTNIKHNLFSLSSGITQDFDRELVKNYIKTSLKTDKLHDFLYKTDDKDLTPSQIRKKTKTLARIEKWERKLKGHYITKTHELIEECKQSNCNHIAMEDLLLSNKIYSKAEDFYNIKYTRLIRMLHISNFKNIIANQCYNNNIQLTIVPSYYTSQRCHKCGFVHEGNRLTQEDFKCLHCGYSGNADYNASQNIKQYVEIDVLRLKKDSVTGWWVSKINNKKVIRKILDDYFEKNSCDAEETPLKYVA